MNTQTAILTLCLALGSAACASSGPNPFEDAQTGASSRTVMVEVQNQNFYDATVYAITAAGERRLGIVAGNGRRTFTARLVGPGDVRLRVRLLGGGNFTTHPMPASPGETLVLIIPAGFDA